MLTKLFLNVHSISRGAVLAVFASVTAFISVACADELGVNEPNTAVTTEAPADPRVTIANVYGGVTVDDVQPTPVPGLYEMLLDGDVFYVSADGEYLVKGTMYKIDENGSTDLSEPRRQQVRSNLINNAGEDTMIVFSPEGETKHTITVFTDTSCYYCRELHKQMEGYNDLGIEVRYMAYPRRGPTSADAQLMRSVWCASDKQAAMTAAKAQQAVPPAQCNAPIQNHFLIGRQVGVTGTPAIVTDKGQLIPGYRPPQDMLAALNAE